MKRQLAAVVFMLLIGINIVLADNFQIIDLVKEYSLANTSKITVIPVYRSSHRDETKVEIQDKDDIARLLRTLMNVKYEKGAEHRCFGDYDLNFHTDKGIVSLNLGHKHLISAKDGLCYMGDDFIEVLKRYKPAYFKVATK
jgi:hypothetical protein